MDFEPELEPDLFDKEFDLAEDYDDHAWDEEELAEEEE